MLSDLLVSLGFDLSDTFSGDAEDLAHFFKSVSIAIEKAVTHFKDLPLLRR